MKAASKVTPGWWIADGFFNKGGKALVGPFTSRDDALTAREAIEPLSGRMDLHVDEFVAPAVDLPTRPTLGWANWALGKTACLAVWISDETRIVPVDSEADGVGIHAEYVTSFTPAVAVPKTALDELRDLLTQAVPSDREGDYEWLWNKVGLAGIKFLRAVDAANGDPR